MDHCGDVPICIKLIVIVTERIPRGHRAIADQLKRSATSIVANIAEGANRRGAGECRQRFVQARGEAGEADAWIESLVALDLVTVEEVVAIARALDRVAGLLPGLIRKQTA